MTEQVRETTAAPTRTGGDGRYRVALIDAGQGSSGHYPAATLERAAADRVFHAGMHVYWDHQDATEAASRPERTLRDLAGVLTEDATYDPASESLTSAVQVFSPYRPLVEEMRDHIGLSINGRGDIAEGVVRRLAHADSVDFVTRPGRGGRVLPVLEADRPTYDTDDLAALTAAGIDPTDNPGNPPVVTEAARGQEGAIVASEDTELRESTRLTLALREAEQQATAAVGERDEARSELDELRTQLAAAQAQIAQFTATEAARPVVAAVLGESEIVASNPITTARLTREALRDLPLVDGHLDEATLRARVAEARTEAETEAAARLTESGQPRGLGDTHQVRESGDEPDEYTALFGQKG